MCVSPIKRSGAIVVVVVVTRVMVVVGVWVVVGHVECRWGRGLVWSVRGREGLKGFVQEVVTKHMRRVS